MFLTGPLPWITGFRVPLQVIVNSLNLMREARNQERPGSSDPVKWLDEYVALLSVPL